MKSWLYRKGHIKTEDITYKRFVSLATSITHRDCTTHNAKEYLYNWIVKNSRLKESARANRIRESNVKENKTLPKRNGFNGGFNNKRSGRGRKATT
jgi:hypothetical protein